MLFVYRCASINERGVMSKLIKTIALDDETKKIVDQYPEINWSAVFRKAVLRAAILAKKIDEELK